MSTPTLAHLKQAMNIAEQIEKLQAELANVLAGGSAPKVAPAFSASSKPGGKRTMSPETIAKMKAAQQARWAKKKGAVASFPKAASSPKKKGGISPEGRAKLAASMKARWAARKKAAKS